MHVYGSFWKCSTHSTILLRFQKQKRGNYFLTIRMKEASTADYLFSGDFYVNCLHWYWRSRNFNNKIRKTNNKSTSPLLISVIVLTETKHIFTYESNMHQHQIWNVIESGKMCKTSRIELICLFNARRCICFRKINRITWMVLIKCLVWTVFKYYVHPNENYRLIWEWFDTQKTKQNRIIWNSNAVAFEMDM